MTLGNTLRNTVELNEETAEYLQQQLLDHLPIPEGWSVEEYTPEPSVDPEDTGDAGIPSWNLLKLTKDDSENAEVAIIEVLQGGHLLQLYRDDIEEYSNPTYDSSDLVEFLTDSQ